MKKILSIVLAATMALSVTACSGSGTEQSSSEAATTAAQEEASQEDSSEAAEDTEKAVGSGETIKIGCIQDLSATTAVTGVALAEGVRWRVEEINAAGGINGKQIELIEYDSKASVDESVNAYNRLVSEGVVAVVGPLQSNIGIALASIAEEAGIPYVTNANDNRVTRQGDDGRGDVWSYMFTAQPSLDEMGAIMAKYALEELGYSKSGIIYRADNAYSQARSNSFQAYSEANGGEIVSVQSFLSTDTDYRTLLGKLISEDIDCIFAPNYIQELVVMTQQARALGYEGTIISGLEAAPPFASMCGPEADGTIFLSNVDLEGEDVLAVVDKWVESTGNEAPDQLNKFCLGYDELGMIAQCIEAAGEDPAAIRDALENLTDFQGLTGTISIDPATHQPKPMGMIIGQVEDGKDVCITNYAAEPVIN